MEQVGLFSPESLLVSVEGDLCLSGGAKGADSQWGMTAGSAGHGVIHWSYEGHRPQVPDIEIVRLTQEQLEVADESLHRANQSLGRTVPVWKSWLCNLLRRNYYQVKWTERVYAVGQFDDKGMIAGGTSWATQMYMDRFIHDGEPVEKCELYFFDQVRSGWLSWNAEDRRWYEIESPPVPHGIWTGIGTRDLTESGKTAIRTLMSWKKPE